eukprot:Skav208157  [mRNA]  locus=scaffold2891:121214:123540:+ [translate_table: standard]
MADEGAFWAAYRHPGDCYRADLARPPPPEAPAPPEASPSPRAKVRAPQRDEELARVQGHKLQQVLFSRAGAWVDGGGGWMVDEGWMGGGIWLGGWDGWFSVVKGLFWDGWDDVGDDVRGCLRISIWRRSRHCKPFRLKSQEVTGDMSGAFGWMPRGLAALGLIGILLLATHVSKPQGRRLQDAWKGVGSDSNVDLHDARVMVETGIGGVKETDMGIGGVNKEADTSFEAVLAKMMKPMQPFYIQPVTGSIKIVLQFTVFGFGGIRFQKSSPEELESWSGSLKKLGKQIAPFFLLALASNGVYRDIHRILQLGGSAGAVVVAMASSSNYLGAVGLFGIGPAKAFNVNPWEIKCSFPRILQPLQSRLPPESPQDDTEKQTCMPESERCSLLNLGMSTDNQGPHMYSRLFEEEEKEKEEDSKSESSEEDKPSYREAQSAKALQVFIVYNSCWWLGLAVFLELVSITAVRKAHSNSFDELAEALRQTLEERHAREYFQTLLLKAASIAQKTWSQIFNLYWTLV